MPAKRPQATFEPIPPDFDVRELVESTDNFQYVDRISCEMIEQQGVDAFEKLVLLHVIIGGKPLVVDGFEDLLDPWTFTPKWLIDNHGGKVENARNLTNQQNLPLTIRHYLNNMGSLTEQFFQKSSNYKDKNRQRMYLKDIDCPPVWHDKLKEQIPAGVFYLNESTGAFGGVGAVDEPIIAASGRRNRGYGRAGDLMSSLPADMRAENLMCYIGHEGTYTPSHKEMCASLGQNIMVDASTAVGEDGKPERPGSSLWFMTETKDRHLVQEYWLSILGHDIEVENHFAQIMAWVSAPFRTYVVEQRPGDFILIPPLAPHQVWNRGTRTMKVAWNRTTVETLEMAINEAIPNARMVCRDEQYKNKAIIYYTLTKYGTILKNVKLMCEANPENAYAYSSNIKIRQLNKDFKRLFDLYKNIVLSEMFAVDGAKEHPEFLPFDSNVTCAYCRGNIFNRFLTCKACPRALGTDVDEPYDVCMDCYVMGRSCACTSDLKWCEQWRWKDLLYKYEEWRRIIIDIDGGVTEKTPQQISEERRYYGKKTLAQICQEQLRIRPWVDIQNPQQQEENEEDESRFNEDGTLKKTPKKQSKNHDANHKACHVCLHKHPKWKMANCQFCDLWYCYGSLYRAQDLLPQTVMEDLHWKCPHCRRQCNTGRCRADPRQRPFEPKGTLLGHDTRKVADVRSIEALFNYGISNLHWTNEEGDPRASSRLIALQAAAERAKQQDSTLDPHFEDEHGIRFSPVHETTSINGGIDDTMIDPALGGTGISKSSTNNNEDLNSELEVENANGFDDGLTSYHDAGDSNKKKRKRGEQIQIQLKTKAPKRQKKNANEEPEQEASGPVSAATDATKEFRRQQEQKLLAQAREEDRYIIVWGAMRAKKLLVKLDIDSHKLVEITSRPPAGGLPIRRRQINNGASRQTSTNGVILQSDVNKPSPKSGDKASNGGPAKPVSALVRVRGEKDDTYTTRKRWSEPSQKKGGYQARTLEEIDIPSDGEVSEEEYAPRAQRRRVMDEEELVQLPDDFKDGTVNRRHTTGQVSGSTAQIRPPPSKQNNGKFARPSLPSKAHLEAQAKAAREAAAQMDEANRKAKMMAAGMADEDVPITIPDDDSNTSSSEGELVARLSPQPKTPTAPVIPVTIGFTPVNTKPSESPQERRSIFDKMKNKNVKIVGRSSKTKTLPIAKAGAAVSNLRADSESEDSEEISAPAPAKKRGRPRKVP
ncbi:hypothetical protein EJ05DRAFT_474888 [Pseudovirgaria hyperparasitica]|uniref:JmjC domain-containing protein n=1 Tax=Pseudovirgaria hyperparasitica TaxID=470096 RepID=A0A6A6WAY8_9PEZI|nr:uncharacterized protein EJ05DRAFT_474888 [Pseudovirgaria hyperparasitica]KAF2759833.1 hypothetical protein EJ05DRAFT_474888 [Pseudovirgaria hyperparasitica]